MSTRPKCMFRDNTRPFNDRLPKSPYICLSVCNYETVDQFNNNSTIE